MNGTMTLHILDVLELLTKVALHSEVSSQLWRQVRSHALARPATNDALRVNSYTARIAQSISAQTVWVEAEVPRLLSTITSMPGGKGPSPQLILIRFMRTAQWLNEYYCFSSIFKL
jgi:hypothetical protein